MKEELEVIECKFWDSKGSEHPGRLYVFPDDKAQLILECGDHKVFVKMKRKKP